MSTESAGDLHLLVFPFPAQGHLIPLLDLAHHLFLRLRPRLSITVVVTPSNLPLLGNFLAATPSASPLVLPFPSSSIAEHVRHLSSISSLAALIHSLSALRPAIASWARSCPLPPSALLSDFFLGWTHHLATDLGIPSIVFYGIGAFGVSVLDFVWQHMPSSSSSPVLLSSLPLAPSFPYRDLPFIFRCYSAGDPDWEFTRESFLVNTSCWGAVINTFDALEEDYIAHLRRSHGHDRFWAVGPIHPTGAPGGRGGNSSVPAEEVLAWLDTCPSHSVVYICFGSQYVPKAAQAAAIAAALETSGVRFLWAIGEGTVPEGFRGEHGMVIRGWAPQAAILAHGAVASFVSHCGWNSVLEAVTAGVSLLAWPMQAEQFVNTRLLTEGARVAARVAEGGVEGVPSVDELARALAGSVAEGGAWSEMRARAADLRRRAAEAVTEGGSSHGDFEELVQRLVELGQNSTE